MELSCTVMAGGANVAGGMAAIGVVDGEADIPCLVHPSISVHPMTITMDRFAASARCAFEPIMAGGGLPAACAGRPALLP